MMKRRHVIALPACAVLAVRSAHAAHAMDPELSVIALEQALK